MLANDVRDDYEIIEGVKIMAPSPGWATKLFIKI